MLTFIQPSTISQGVTDLSTDLVLNLKAGKKILWLICGGSNVSAGVEILNVLKRAAIPSELQNLTVSLTDERFGPVGHPDSNWKQIVDAGFDFNAVNSIPVLEAKSLEETVDSYSKNIKVAMQTNDVTIGLFGMGADGHIAGVLPNTIGVESVEVGCGYVSEKFTRITLTLNTLKGIDSAYLFAFGGSKLEALDSLKNKDISLNEQPAQVLKDIRQAKVYSDLKV